MCLIVAKGTRSGLGIWESGDPEGGVEAGGGLAITGADQLGQQTCYNECELKNRPPTYFHPTDLAQESLSQLILT